MFGCNISRLNFIWTLRYPLALCLIASILNSCGKAYFPLEIKTKGRLERGKQQEQMEPNHVPLTKKEILKANNHPYKER